MKNTKKQLPKTEELTEEIEHLKIEKDRLAHENEILSEKVKWYEEQIRLAKQKKFGASSEQSNPDQLSFFNEMEIETDSKVDEPTIETITYNRRKQVGKREVQLENLRQETIEYTLTKDEQVCPCCQGELHTMSKETRREIKIIPAEAIVVNHVSYIYACRRCEKENIETPIIKAAMPKPPIPNGIASPSAIAFIMSQKYSEAMPLYRQEKYLNNLGVDLSRQTMANWMTYSAEHWLDPLYHRMREHLLDKEIIHADETTIQVLREEDRKPTSESYMWLYRTGKSDVPIVLYDYQPTRKGQNAERFLDGFKGYLQTDGYSGYHKVPDVTHVGCWAHARRYFHEAINAMPEASQSRGYAVKGMKFCSDLFQIEHHLEDHPELDVALYRKEHSEKVLSAFLTWLKEMRPRVTPKSHLGKAIQYALNQWNFLYNFMLDERLAISNNIAERSIKPFVIGRKNWLFSNTPKGARSSALIYSIVETAKENGLVPFEYLKYLFEQLPNIDLKNQEHLDAIMPWSATLPDICKVPMKK